MPTWPPTTWTVGEDPTAAKYNERIRDAFRDLFPIIHEQEFTSSITNAAWTSSAVTFNGNPIIIEWYIPAAVGPPVASASIMSHLQRDGVDYLHATPSLNNLIANADQLGVVLRRRVAAPSSGSHTYGLRAPTGGPSFFATAACPAVLVIKQKGGP